MNEKSNEIEAIPHLIEILDLEGAVVTIDAAGCQKQIAAAIVDNGGDYVLALKRNHPTLHDEVANCFETAVHARDPKLKRIRRREQGHGRRECREFFVLPAPPELHERDGWKRLTSMGMASRHWIDDATGEERGDVRFYLISFPPLVTKFAQASRPHWGIESSLHWVLDVAFREDACKVVNCNAAANVSAMNRIALSVLKSNTTIKRGVATKRKVAGWSDDYLIELLNACIGS